MRIAYIGGRSRIKVSPNRKSYYFTPENDRTLDIEDQNIINYIFSLPNRAEFQAVDARTVVEETIPEKIVEVVKKVAGRPKKGV